MKNIKNHNAKFDEYIIDIFLTFTCNNAGIYINYYLVSSFSFTKIYNILIIYKLSNILYFILIF